MLTAHQHFFTEPQEYIPSQKTESFGINHTFMCQNMAWPTSLFSIPKYSIYSLEEVMRSSKSFSFFFPGRTLAPRPALCASHTWERWQRSRDIRSAHTLELGFAGKLQTMGPAKLIKMGHSNLWECVFLFLQCQLGTCHEYLKGHF